MKVHSDEATALVKELNDVLNRFGASIFFRSNPGMLWLLGEYVADIDHEEGGTSLTIVRGPHEHSQNSST